MSESQDIRIRPEAPADVPHIHRIIEAAFAGKPYADGDEQDLVDTLRNLGALTLSLVAERDGEIIGHIAFSPAFTAASTQSWFALGPVAVQPAMQGMGVGALLIESGLERLRENEADGCILTGDPGYYERFGFAVSPAHAPAEEPAEFFMVKLLNTGQMPTATIRFHSAFHDEPP